MSYVRRLGDELEHWRQRAELAETFIKKIFEDGTLRKCPQVATDSPQACEAWQLLNTPKSIRCPDCGEVYGRTNTGRWECGSGCRGPVETY